MSDIKKVSKYRPRSKSDPELVDILAESYLRRDKIPLIVLNTEKILVDGWLRLKAQEQIGRQKVEATIIDIPESEVYVEAIRRNLLDGLEFTREEKGQYISYLYFIRKKTLKEIYEMIGGDWRDLEDILFCENIPIDYPEIFTVTQRKWKYYLPDDMASALKQGVPALDISRKFRLNELNLEKLRSMDVKKGMKVICDTQLLELLWPSIYDRRVEYALNFKPEGLVIRRVISDIDAFNISYFSPSSFLEYEVDEEFSFYLLSTTLYRLFYLSKISDVMMFSIKEYSDKEKTMVINFPNYDPYTISSRKVYLEYQEIKLDLSVDVSKYVDRDHPVNYTHKLTFRRNYLNDIKPYRSYMLHTHNNKIFVTDRETKQAVKSIPLIDTEGDLPCTISVRGDLLEDLSMIYNDTVNIYSDLKNKYIMGYYWCKSYWRLFTHPFLQ
jgi:hypothetical protein